MPERDAGDSVERDASDPPAPDAAASDDDDSECGCDSTRCSGHGRCGCAGSSAICACDSRYVGETCSECEAGFGLVASGACVALIEAPADDSCAADTCGDHGTCADTASGPVCSCEAGYDGAYCEGCASGYVARTGACAPAAALQAQQEEAFGSNCEVGGTATLSGLDLDDDGDLDPEEVIERSYQCASRNVTQGSVFVTNQAELDALVGVNQITGQLTISTQFVRTLTPLSGLVQLGSLTISGNLELENLSGLEHLTRVGLVQIVNNSALRDTAALSSVVAAGGLTVQHNAGLLSLGPFTSLTQCSSVDVADNAELLEIGDFASLVTITGGLTILVNPKLARVHGFPMLDAVASAVLIRSNPLLVEVSGFGALTDVAYLELEDNASLQLLSAFDALETVRGVLSVRGHAALQELSGFPALRQVNDGVVIDNNPGLVAIDAFHGLKLLGVLFSISGNAELRSIHAFDALEAIRAGNSPTMNCGVPVCAPVPGDVRVSNNPKLESLDGFAMLAEIPKGVELKGNAALETIAGFDALLAASEIVITQSNSLRALSGFAGLQTSQVLVLSYLPKLESMTAFAALSDASIITVGSTGLASFDLPGLATLRTQMTIEDNPELVALDHAFSKLTMAHRQYSDLQFSIWGNPKLAVIDMFSSLPRIDTVYVNDSVAQTIHFGAVAQFSGLLLQGNSLLTEMPDLPANATVGDLEAVENPQLRACLVAQFATTVHASSVTNTGNSAASCN